MYFADYKQQQLVEKLNNMKVQNLSKEEIMKSFDKDEIELIKGEFGKLYDVIEKGKPATMGEIRDWGGKKFKKQPNGKWLEVSEHGMTKKEHQEKVMFHGRKAKLPDSESYDKNKESEYEKESKESQKHLKEFSKLSDKEHSDEEVGLGKEVGSKSLPTTKEIKNLLNDTGLNPNHIFRTYVDKIKDGNRYKVLLVVYGGGVSGEKAVDLVLAKKLGDRLKEKFQATDIEISENEIRFKIKN